MASTQAVCSAAAVGAEAGVDELSPCAQVTTSRPPSVEDLAGDALVEPGARAARGAG